MLILLTLFLLTVLRWFAARGPRICSAHVINMDKHTERLSEIQGYAADAELPLKRWRAVDGAAVKEEDLVGLGISKYIYNFRILTEIPSHFTMTNAPKLNYHFNRNIFLK